MSEKAMGERCTLLFVGGKRVVPERAAAVINANVCSCGEGRGVLQPDYQQWQGEAGEGWQAAGVTWTGTSFHLIHWSMQWRKVLEREGDNQEAGPF